MRPAGMDGESWEAAADGLMALGFLRSDGRAAGLMELGLPRSDGAALGLTPKGCACAEKVHNNAAAPRKSPLSIAVF